MQWFFDKLEGFRSLILTALAEVAVYGSFVQAAGDEVFNLFSQPLGSPEQLAVFLPMALVTGKTIIDKWRKARGSASIV